MFIEEHKGKLYELLFVECSRLICLEQKKDDDKVKLWREMNDGLYYVYSGCRPDKNEFGIIGVQIAGDMLHFNTIIKDMDDIHWLYHLYSVKIPIRPTGSEGVFQFIEVLLNLRNIIITNMSLLYHSSEARSQRLRKRSSTISSDKEDN